MDVSESPDLAESAMYDPELDGGPVLRGRPSPIGRPRPGIPVVLGLALIVLGLMSGKPLGSKSLRTCVYCRAIQEDWRCLGFSRSRLYEGLHCAWYDAHVEPSHSHLWERGTGPLGPYSWPNLAAGEDSLWNLSFETQMEVYRHFPSPKEAKPLFASFAEGGANHARFEGPDALWGRSLVEAMEDWRKAGFPGTWKDWSGRWRRDHIGGREETQASSSE
jgi:hypothetical protein